MKLFIIKYTDDYDPCCPVFTTTVRAFNREHAEMKFYDDAVDAHPEWENGGWKIISIEVKKP